MQLELGLYLLFRCLQLRCGEGVTGSTCWRGVAGWQGVVGRVARDGTRWRVGLIGWKTETRTAEGEADLGLRA